MRARPARGDVPLERTWNLDDIYPSPEACVADLEAVLARLPAALPYRGHLGDGPDTLLACLRLRDDLEQVSWKALYYARHRLAEDRRDGDRQALHERAATIWSRVGEAFSFLPAELGGLPVATVEAFIVRVPGLGVYRRYMTHLRAESRHRLGPEAERAIAALGALAEAPLSVWEAATSADIRFAPVRDAGGQTVQMSLATYWRLAEDPDRRVRAAAYHSLREGYGAHRHVIAAAFSAAHRHDAAVARLRGYPSSLASALADEGAPESLVRGALAAAARGIPLFQRHLEWRRRRLGLARLQPYDLLLPLADAVDAPITFEEGYALIVDALAPLGARYRSVLERARAERWIDWADNEGKAPEAWAADAYGCHPLVIVTWQHTMFDVFLLAHELGHLVNSVFTAEARPYVQFGNPPFLAEMASLTNEVLLARHLVRSAATPVERAQALARALDVFHEYLFGLGRVVELQLESHRMAEAGEPLTYETITAANAEILRRWHGEAVEVAPEGYAASWCENWRHFRNFYGYQYLTGLAAAVVFADAVEGGGEAGVVRYLRFLEAGSSRTPTETLADAAVDLSAAATWEGALGQYETWLGELENAQRGWDSGGSGLRGGRVKHRRGGPAPSR